MSVEYTYPDTDVAGRKYRQLTLPGGTFRMYQDRPNMWVPQPESEDWFWHGLKNMEG